MGECKACVVDEAVNGSNSFGTLCFPNMIYHTDTANQGMLCVHGHQHDIARKSSIPVADEQAFWGVLGCSCFAF